MIFCVLSSVNYRPVGILALYHGRWYLCGKRGIGSGTDSGEYLHAVYNRTVSVSILFAVGNSTIVAIFLGQGEKQKANEVFTQNVVLLCILSVLITILVMIFLDPFARFLGATDHILPYARTYIGTIAPFSVVYILSYSFETLIKTDGYPKLATIYVTSGAVLNCILDYILVMVLHKGVWGAAFATGISQAAVILLYLWHFWTEGTIRFTKFHLMHRKSGGRSVTACLPG